VKGKHRVYTREGKFVIHLAGKIEKKLKPFCRKIKIVGSILRKEKAPVDIDIILIPKNSESKEKIICEMKKLGRFVQGGEKRVTFRVGGVKTELYFSKKEDWGAMLLAYTGPKGSSIGLRMIAKRKGMLLNQYGLFRAGRELAGKTERGIYRLLGKKWKKPEER